MIVLLLAACHPTQSPIPFQHPIQITIAAINDFHGALDEKPVQDHPDRARGGLPVLAGAIDQMRADDPDLVLLDGGDEFQGDWAVNYSEGRGSVEAFDLLKVDVTAVGNHEFDYGDGPEGTNPLTGALETAFLQSPRFVSANIAKADGTPWSPDGLRPWRMVERGPVKIGVIGLSTMETPQTTLAKNVEGLVFQDPVETLRRVVPEVRGAGADVIVVVGHLTGKCEPKGYYDLPPADCVPDGEIGRVLTELPEGTIDVFVTGHAHTLLAQRIGKTFVVQNRNAGAAIGEIDLMVGPNGVMTDASSVKAPWAMEHAKLDPGCDPGEYSLAPLDVGGRMVTPSAAGLALARDIESKAPSLCEKVACAADPLFRNRNGESGLGDVVADAMIAAFPGADGAVTNSGGLRGDIPAGDVRRGTVQSVMPFDNKTILVEMTGQQIRELLRIGASGAHGVLQVSGVSYAFDPAATAGTDRDADGKISDWERDRLCGGSVGTAPIDDAKTYHIVTTDFLYTGGDAVGPAFAGTKIVGEGPLVRDAILTWMQARTACVTSPVSAAHPRVAEGACK